MTHDQAFTGSAEHLSPPCTKVITVCKALGEPLIARERRRMPANETETETGVCAVVAAVHTVVCLVQRRRTRSCTEGLARG